MTGFAAAAHESATGSLAVELKTVNHRYLEFQTRIPEELRPLEPAMREAIAARLTRGKVDCRVTFTPLNAAERSVLPDEKALTALPPGSSYTEPPNTPHFARTREEVVLQIVGYGPSSTTYVNPADDPNRK